MTGTRKPENAHYKDLATGDYCLHTWTGQPMWVLRDPAGRLCSLGKAHQVTEHEDGTITVSPSILDTTPGGWHGFLERGVWREC